MELNIESIEAMREGFLGDKTPAHAIRILEELINVSGDYNNLDDSEYWPEICAFLLMLLKAVPPCVMLREHQIVMLSLINNAPERFVQSIVDDYFQPNLSIDRAMFKMDALAVLVALSRRIRGPICYESVANFLRHFVDCPEVIRELESQLEDQTDSEKRFRVYQVALSALVLENFNNFGAIKPIIDGLLRELDESNLLNCITALEVLSEATAARKENAQFFSSVGLLDKTYDMFERSRNNPDGGLIHSACIRFFGYLTHIVPNALVRYPSFAREVFDMIYHFDRVEATKRQLAFDTLAIISTTSTAKQFLFSPECPYNMNKAMNHFGVVIASSPEDLRVRLLSSLKLMMNESQSEADSCVLEHWFSELGKPFPTLIFHFLRKPFDDVKVASLQLLEVLFQYDWSAKQFASVNGFFDYLLDRKPGNSAQVCQLKYDVLKLVLVKDPTPETVGGIAVLDRIKDYCNRGVYFAQQEQSVDWGNI